MHAAVLLAGLAVTASLVAGCSEDPPVAGATVDPPCLVERPDDRSCLDANATSVDRPHLHDYWGGQDRLVVMDATAHAGSVGFNEDGQWFMLRPDPDHVVPQGTSEVQVTIAWTAYEPTHYSDTELMVVTAADREPWVAGPVASGDTVVIPSDNSRNDLPHQRLSAWQFILHAAPADPLGGVIFQADVTIRVEAVRGLDIPLYPGHPDLWQGRTEIALFDEEVPLGILHGGIEVGPASAGPCIFACLETMRPDDGAIVPYDAAFVEVVVTHDQDLPFRVGMTYHGAADRDTRELAPETDDGTTRTYRIPVGPDGDGPYAKQSLWEFRPFVEAPEKDGAFAGSYSVTARVLKDA